MSETSHQRADEQELSIGQLLAMFWRGRWIILTATSLAVLLGFLYVLRRGAIWRAEAQVYVKQPTSGDDAIGGLLGIASKNFANTQASVLRSDVILRAALADFEEASLGLVDHPVLAVFPEDVVGVARIDWLREKLSVGVGRDDDVITVSLDSPNRDAAASLVNAVVQAFRAHLQQRQASSAEEFYGAFIADMQDLEEQEASIREDRSELARLHDLDAQRLSLQRISDSIRRTEDELAELERDVAQVEQDIEAIDQITPVSARLDLQARLIQDLEQRRIGRLARFPAAHPSVKTVSAAIDQARQAFDAEAARLRDERRRELDLAQAAIEARRASLIAGLEELENEYRDLNAHYLEYDDLGRQLDLIAGRFRALSQERSLAGAEMQEKAKNAETMEVLSLPSADRLKDVSGRSVRLILALMLGLFSGAGIVWLLELLDQRIRNADEAVQLLETQLLGSMPRVLPLAGESESEALDRWEQDRIYAEAARSLRTQVYFGLPAGEGRVLQVTSPEQGDGKSTTASHLAIAMAKAGQRTLLVDADLRRPRQCGIFGLEAGQGLSEVLSGQLGPESAPVQSTGVEFLDVLTSGRVPANPAEMLNHQRLVDLLSILGERYDRIIVDSPPVLPVADASILATRCDATILVLRAERSTRKRARTAYQALRRVGGSVLGLVLNDVPRVRGYGRRYGYGNYGYYADRYVQDSPEHGETGSRDLENAGGERVRTR